MADEFLNLELSTGDVKIKLRPDLAPGHVARIKELTVDEVEAFYARWPGSYVEDRLRNDWLLELGRRRDLAEGADGAEGHG